MAESVAECIARTMAASMAESILLRLWQLSQDHTTAWSQTLPSCDAVSSSSTAAHTLSPLTTTAVWEKERNRESKEQGRGSAARKAMTASGAERNAVAERDREWVGERESKREREREGREQAPWAQRTPAIPRDTRERDWRMGARPIDSSRYGRPRATLVRDRTFSHRYR